MFFRFLDVLFVTDFFTLNLSGFLLKVLNLPLTEEEISARVSLLSLVSVLLQVEKSRWMTAALFGPLGNQTNNPIMLPPQIGRAARQRLCAI